ncbi:MAG TPA: signal peptidase II [Candidatus Limiplasma sp.]|nr:signal peptidase II [Candidatus Limiplasma sp.]HRX09625.1 signal peptidase II [Candidatus Limiplasma sp.]
MTFFWIVSALVLIADRAAKLLTQQFMMLGQRIVWIGGVLQLRYTHNDGMALGFLSGYTVAGIVLPLIAVAFGVFVLRKYKLSRYLWVAAALIFGGFLANFADRVLFGYVVDMIYFPWLPFFICNIADIAITLGAVLTAISLIFRPGDWELKQAEGAGNDQNPDG